VPRSNALSPNAFPETTHGTDTLSLFFHQENLLAVDLRLVALCEGGNAWPRCGGVF